MPDEEERDDGKRFEGKGFHRVEMKLKIGNGGTEFVRIYSV